MFVNTWALAGLLGIGVPLAVHWLTKPRPVPLPISTLRFVRESIQQRRARHRLKDWLVLALRMAGVGLFVFAMARPRQQQAMVVESNDGDVFRVVLIDASQSMAAVSNGATVMQRARVKAGDHLRYRAGLRANLIVGGAQPQAVFDTPSQNLKALRDHLATVEPRPERVDVQRALNQAGEMLAEAHAGQQDRHLELVLISDFQRSSWANADFSVLPQDTLIQFESATQPEPIANLGILQCGVTGRATAGGKSQLAIEVGNFSDSPQHIVVEVTLCGAAYRLESNCAENSRITLSQLIEFDKPGWCTGEARLANHSDALPADDRRPLAVHVQSQPRFLIATRQPAQQRPSSSFYLQCALTPDHNEGASSQHAIRLLPEEIDGQQLATFDVVLLDHPGKLSQETIELLANAMQRGRPLLYVASESVDAINLEQIVDAAQVRLPVDFAPPLPRQERRDLFWTSIQEESSPFAIFGDGLAGIVSNSRFSGGLNSKVRDDGIQEEILASYQDNSASLIVGGSDTARLAVLNADLGRSNLATTGALVPLLDQLVDDLLYTHRRIEDAVCGELLVARLPPQVTAANDLKIVPPRPSSSSNGAIAHDGIGVVWTWQQPDTPGVFQIQRRGETQFAQAIHIPADESPLETLPRDVLTDRLAAGRASHYRSANQSRESRDVAWTWLLTACVCCVLGELTSLLCFKT